MHKLIHLAKTHPKLAIVAAVALVAVLYLVFFSGSKETPAQAAAAEADTLKAEKMQISGQESIASIQAKAAETPYQEQTQQAQIGANAQTAAAKLAAGVQNNSIAAALQQALASITGSVTLGTTADADQLSLGTLESNNNLLGLENTNNDQEAVAQSADTTSIANENDMATLEEYLATLEKTGQGYFQGIFPGGGAGGFQYA